MRKKKHLRPSYELPRTIMFLVTVACASGLMLLLCTIFSGTPPPGRSASHTTKTSMIATSTKAKCFDSARMRVIPGCKITATSSKIPRLTATSTATSRTIRSATLIAMEDITRTHKASLPTRTPTPTRTPVPTRTSGPTRTPGPPTATPYGPLYWRGQIDGYYYDSSVEGSHANLPAMRLSPGLWTWEISKGEWYIIHNAEASPEGCAGFLPFYADTGRFRIRQNCTVYFSISNNSFNAGWSVLLYKESN